jgi:hypothetical protein
MSSRDKKAQVGARVPGDLLDRAKNAAVSLGVSFNSWVEQAFNLKLGDNTEPPQPLPGQTSILDAERPRPRPASSPDPGRPAIRTTRRRQGDTDVGATVRPHL